MRDDFQLIVPQGTVKARKGNFVIYDINYLLENLANEIYILMKAKYAKTASFSGTISMSPEDHEKLIKLLDGECE